VSPRPQCQHDNPRRRQILLGVRPPAGAEVPELRHRAARPRPARFGSPDSYTPKHLAERILTSKTALEGERKQITLLFADVVHEQANGTWPARARLAATPRPRAGGLRGDRPGRRHPRDADRGAEGRPGRPHRRARASRPRARRPRDRSQRALDAAAHQRGAGQGLRARGHEDRARRGGVGRMLDMARANSRNIPGAALVR
jgi:hypothetical protein